MNDAERAEAAEAALWRIRALLQRAPGGMVAKITAEVESALGLQPPAKSTP